MLSIYHFSIGDQEFTGEIKDFITGKINKLQRCKSKSLLSGGITSTMVDAIFSMVEFISAVVQFWAVVEFISAVMDIIFITTKMTLSASIRIHSIAIHVTCIELCSAKLFSLG